MIIAHIEGGLGNQMLDYADLLAIKKANPKQKCYIETIVYDIKESHSVISMWNGYELDKIFGIKEENILDTVCQEKRDKILRDVKKTEFWKNDWAISSAICEGISNNLIKLKNLSVDQVTHSDSLRGTIRKKISEKFFYTRTGYMVKRFASFVVTNIRLHNKESELFPEIEDDIYYGHTLKFMYRGYGIDRIEKEIRKTFAFPKIIEKQNLDILKIIKDTNSIAIHARRGDFLSRNRSYYEYGYFSRAVKYMKKKIEKPVFIFFCDPESVGWAKDNLKTFSLNEDTDKILFVDWNSGDCSFRDMQLMALCKHNIITNSSFGWWGAYLNSNPRKITISPDARINTTHHF